MSYFPGMQKGNLDSVKSDAHGRIKKETVALQGVSVTRVTFDVGAKWSNDLKDYAGTDSCKLPHVALVLSGTLRVVMDDGSQQDFSKNDVMLLPPGHDAWSVGSDALRVRPNSPVAMTITRANTGTESISGIPYHL
jgi:hypothetical protein